MPKLTDRFIATFKPEGAAKDRLTFDTECKGLGVRATVAGSKGFIVQWNDAATGRKVREPLGAWGSITVEQARAAARARLGRVAQGINPAAERAAARAADEARRAAQAVAKEEARFTLDALIADWARLHLAGKRARYSAEAERALRVAFKAHLDRPAAALTHAAVIAVLDALAGAGKASMASRTMAYGRACYGWAVKRRRLSLNPFAGLPVIQGGNPTRDRVLTDTEIGAVWRAAGTLGLPFGPLVKLLMLTAQRREEVAAMRWSELSADLGTWTLPPARAKNGKAHIVHLAEPARAILTSVPRFAGRDLVFSTTGSTAPTGFSKAKLALDAAMAKDTAEEAVSLAQNTKTPRKAKTQSPTKADPSLGWRFHDFRRTAVTWLAGAGFPPHVADRLLNHVTGTIHGVAAIYQRGEFLGERKAALNAWAEHVLRCGDGLTQAVNVVSLDGSVAQMS
ncbi:tyrosine-type recombinase/integrase [Belnapia moabensis]|uniref:tyrosine-type recombinase/integrase n=1 Tax=Belnapia moabensis TaxID=365533 RepID=UPI0005BD1568|nr:site-specific integrase [Belnapia moabensis]